MTILSCLKQALKIHEGGGEAFCNAEAAHLLQPYSAQNALYPLRFSVDFRVCLATFEVLFQTLDHCEQNQENKYVHSQDQREIPEARRRLEASYVRAQMLQGTQVQEDF